MGAGHGCRLVLCLASGATTAGAASASIKFAKGDSPPCRNFQAQHSVPTWGRCDCERLLSMGLAPGEFHTSSSTSFARWYRKGVEGEQPCYRCPPLPCTSFPQLATNLQPSVVLSPGQSAREVAADGQDLRTDWPLPDRPSVTNLPQKYFLGGPLEGGRNARLGSNGSSYIRVL